jgi:hypothetical protein
MIKYLIVISCDNCGETWEEDSRMLRKAEAVEWAEGRGWWADPDSVCHYCPACKVSAQLARKMAVRR